MQLSRIPKSTFIKRFQWEGDRIPYAESDIKGDSYPMTWGRDGEILTSCGDPLWGETVDGLDVERFDGGPLDYKISKIHHMNDYRGWGGDGPKPTGLICVDGVYYLAVQNLRGTKVPPHGLLSQHGSDAHIIYATNPNMFWTPNITAIDPPMFQGHKFGGPAFVNFGKNNANARDAYVYAASSDQWDNGSNLRLGRVPADRIIERSAWEFVSSYDAAGAPAWHRSLDESIPILSLHKSIGAPEMVYIAAIERYLLLTWRLHKDFSPTDGTDLFIYEAPEPWGPFALVHHEEYWEGQAYNPYCPRMPLKWMAADGKSGWVQFSGSWGADGQKNLFYRSNVRPFSIELA